MHIIPYVSIGYTHQPVHLSHSSYQFSRNNGLNERRFDYQVLVSESESQQLNPDHREAIRLRQIGRPINYLWSKIQFPEYNRISELVRL